MFVAVPFIGVVAANASRQGPSLGVTEVRVAYAAWAGRRAITTL
jgi:hypothetical protein